MSNNLSDLTEPVYTLKVAATLSGTSVYSIRQYVDKGLLLPFRTDTNRHLFSKTDIQRLKCIRKYLDNMGLNIAGIKAQFAMVPCWNIRPCPIEDRDICEAYSSVVSPCWEVSAKGSECEDVDCRTCNVYQLPNTCNDLKSYLKTVDNQNV